MMIVREVGTQDLDALWDLIGQANLGVTSLKIDFPNSDSLSMINKQLIEDQMPRYPIYLKLLPQVSRFGSRKNVAMTTCV